MFFVFFGGLLRNRGVLSGPMSIYSAGREITGTECEQLTDRRAGDMHAVTLWKRAFQKYALMERMDAKRVCPVDIPGFCVHGEP